MLVRKIILTLSFLFISISSFSQHTEYYYFDSNWNPVTKYEDYYYYRVIEYSSKGVAYVPIKDYYKNGALQAEFYSDKYLPEGVKYSGTASGMGMNNGRNIFYYTDGSYKIDYYQNGKYSYSSDRIYPKNDNNNSELSTGEMLAGAAAVIGIGSLIYNTFFGDDNSSSSSSSSNSTPQYSLSENNVEIISWGTYGPLVWPHALATIRNKNNYDVIVSIKLKQDSWENCELHAEMSDMNGYDYNEDFKKEFKVKANSVRKVSLRGDGSGRPTDIGFRYVN